MVLVRGRRKDAAVVFDRAAYARDAKSVAGLRLATDTMQESPKWIFKWGLLVFPIVTIASSIAYVICGYIL